MGSKSSTELADIIREYGAEFIEQFNPSYSQIKVMHCVSVCRTSVLGGHIDKCDTCGHESILYNSCRNRHCPKCQTLAKEKWLDDRKAELYKFKFDNNLSVFQDKKTNLRLQF